MTKYRARILIMALLVMAFTVSTAYAQNSTWEVEQIESGPDDGFISETGNKYFETPWVQIKSKTTSLTSYFAFRGVDIPDNTTIINAYLQFTAPAPTTFAPNATLDVTIYGLKTGDLTSWDPTPDLENEPSTIALTNWDATPLSHSATINVTVTDQVIEIYELNAWSNGNGMAFRILSVLEPSILAARYQVAYDSDPTDSMKLYIEYLESNATDTYYKGYRITNSILGTGAVITFVDIDDLEVKLLTANGTDYKRRDMLEYVNTVSPDSVVSVGSTIYGLKRAINAPYNTSLYFTTDRGVNWTRIGEIKAVYGTTGEANIGALSYDNVDTIYVAYAQGFDTYVKTYTISNNSISAGFRVFDGSFNIQEHRSYWDEENNAYWITRYGGDASGSERNPGIVRFDNGVWESYAIESGGDMRHCDVVNSDGTMYLGVFDYDITPSSNKMRLYYLANYSDISSWAQLGSGWGDTITGGIFDIGDWFGDPVISYERTVGGTTYIYSVRWKGGPGGSADEDSYNQTGWFPNPIGYQTDVKMYYQRNGELWQVVIAHDTFGNSQIIYNTWLHFNSGWETALGTKFFASSGHEWSWLGGDTFPFSAGSTVFTVYDENGTLIGEFDTLEDAEAGIDEIPGVGQTPDDPNPPGTTYPEDGFGELTRFNVRFVMWGVGWFLIIAPLIIMAVRPWHLKIYLAFILCIALGFALQWSIGSV